MKAIVPSLVFLLFAPVLLAESGLSLSSPLDWQVVQRRSPREGIIPVTGHCDDGADRVEARVTGSTIRATGWVPGSVDPANHNFKIELPTPAGGWYVVEVKALKGGQMISEKRVPHVGIGEVFVGAGQSNSTSCGGYLSKSPLDGRTKTVTGMVTTFDGQSWRIADDPQPGAYDSNQFGFGSFWPSFGDAMAARYKVPIGVAVTGKGGTPIKQWTSRGPLFQWTLKRMNQFGKNGFRAVLWHQGETDAWTPAQQYADGLGKIIADFRKAAGWDMPWFVANASYRAGKPVDEKGARGGQKLIWQRKIAFEGPDTDSMLGDLRDNDGKGTHFSKKGLKVHGEAWAAKVSVWLDQILK